MSCWIFLERLRIFKEFLKKIISLVTFGCLEKSFLFKLKDLGLGTFKET